MGLDIIELIVRIEKEYEIEIPNLEAEKIITVGDCYEIIIQKKTNLIRSEESFLKLKKLVADQTGVEINKINYDTNIINDLRLD